MVLIRYDKQKIYVYFSDLCDNGSSFVIRGLEPSGAFTFPGSCMSSKKLISKISVSTQFVMVLLFLETLIYLSDDMYLPALHSIVDDLSVSYRSVQYTLTAWYAGSLIQIFLGYFVERFDRKKVLLVGVINFTLSSIVCGLSNGVALLVIARFFQGSSCCYVEVAGESEVHDKCDQKKAIKVLSVISLITTITPAIGPVIGAVFVEYTHWRNIFWLLSFLGVIALFGVQFCMEPEKKAKKNVSLKNIMKQYVSVLRNKDFMMFSVIRCMLMAIFFIWITEGPFIIMKTHAKSGFYFSFMQTLIVGSFALGIYASQLMINRYPANRTVTAGLIISAIGAIVLHVGSVFSCSMGFPIVGLMIIFFGIAIPCTPLSRLAIEACSEEGIGIRVAAIYSLVNLSGMVGSFAVTFVENKTFFHLSFFMMFCVVIAVSVYFFGNLRKSKMKIS